MVDTLASIRDSIHNIAKTKCALQCKQKFEKKKTRKYLFYKALSEIIKKKKTLLYL